MTETDYLLFSTMTHNPVAIHLDAEYAKTTEFGRPLMNSVFTSGSMVGIFVGDTKLDNLGWEEVRFPRPVFAGDTLNQVAAINAAFTPSEEELAWSRKVVTLFESNPGMGTVGLEGKMLDLPHLKQAERVLALAQRFAS